jgi:hypothetical protein
MMFIQHELQLSAKQTVTHTRWHVRHMISRKASAATPDTQPDSVAKHLIAQQLDRSSIKASEHTEQTLCHEIAIILSLLAAMCATVIVVDNVAFMMSPKLSLNISCIKICVEDKATITFCCAIKAKLAVCHLVYFDGRAVVDGDAYIEMVVHFNDCAMHLGSTDFNMNHFFSGPRLDKTHVFIDNCLVPCWKHVLKLYYGMSKARDMLHNMPFMAQTTKAPKVTSRICGCSTC